MSDLRSIIQGVLNDHDAEMTDGLLTDIVEAVEAWAGDDLRAENERLRAEVESLTGLLAENERLLRDMGVLRALLDPDNEALVEQIADVAFEKWDTARLGRFNEVARAVLAALRKEADQ